MVQPFLCKVHISFTSGTIIQKIIHTYYATTFEENRDVSSIIYMILKKKLFIRKQAKYIV